ncbi:CDP-glycerol glycerophosphotransferase family protein [Microbacterium halophytorum]|uniref:CDP-glycerol glycerophosphotransferase family protein n=1 Tax=Microbacterium halophytorum TaxID=2067568 RepID=UPI000CFBB1AF|nr:CDP-glycerol glycerophosphotransferase family protein [Microbacterium halophytorum]
MSGWSARTMRGLLVALYGAIKLVTRPRANKIVFLGRRMDRMPLDFRLLMDEVRRREPGIETVVISRLVKGDSNELFTFVPLLVRSMYHLATARVAVLDSYWPTVSMLNHRGSLTVYQLWHSLGKIKQSGKQAIGRAGGRSAEVARAMRMHEGYDYVVAGAEVWNPFYRASFGVDDAQILNLGQPRADYLLHDRDRVAARIRSAYPRLGRDKPVVLYVPTFRRGERGTGALKLATALDLDRYDLVIKKHDSDDLLEPPQAHFTCDEFTGTQLLTVADYIVTDYSSIALEAAILDVRTFYFLYDYEHYLANNGVNIDLYAEMPGCVFQRADELVGAIDGVYPDDVLAAYKRKFLFPDPGHSTRDLTDHIFEVGGLCRR